MRLISLCLIVMSCLLPAQSSAPQLDYFSIPYGSEPGQLMDIYLNPESRDLVLWIPGSWSMAPLGEVPEPDDFLGEIRAAGYHVGRLQVRPSEAPEGMPETYWPHPEDDVKAAVQLLRDHPNRLSYPIDTITLVGRSAGGVRALGAEFGDPTVKLFDALVVIAACSDLTQLPPGAKSAAPYFGVETHADVPPEDLEEASAIPLIELFGVAQAAPVLVMSGAKLASQFNANDPHAAYYGLLLNQTLLSLGHSSAFVWTPGIEPSAANIVEWLDETLPE